MTVSDTLCVEIKNSNTNFKSGGSNIESDSVYTIILKVYVRLRIETNIAIFQ